ncbi:MAG TPA: flagellar assembly peptidoglycan hydrolase FlgJ [Burkholderiales bacterium]|nr:flagellar assembly peptidoglycan hydrolase FlgJ [Burkholderiales bacterium]
MAIDPALSSRMALDAGALDDLKTQARQSPDRALRQAAQQFEAVFMNMLLKSMRDTLPQDGPFSSDTTRMYTGMLDQQMAQKFAEGEGLGLADMLVKQLSTHLPQPAPVAAPVATPASAAASSAARMPPAAADTPDAFVERMLPHARIAARRTGLPAQFVIGQAALESGWGKHEIRAADGTPTHNLFGIKAGSHWKGRTVEVRTTEYIDGQPRKVVERFRAYDSYADAFTDWARLMAGNPRYAKVLEAKDAAQFAQRLERAGYATDPLYAEKLTRVINRQLSARREG